jgi:uncharacterized protein (TIGR03067 family)
MRQPAGPHERIVNLQCTIASVPRHQYDHLWLEESRRIRGKGLTQLQLLTNQSLTARSSCRLFADPGESHGEQIVAKNLPARPNLDHLRRQAKSLLSALESGEPEAVSTILEHLPAAKGLTIQQLRKTRIRLADAQSAIARKTGFASWPQLAHHVEQLRSLEGTWSFASLEIDGHPMPPGMLSTSHILIDGDRFRTESPEAIYEGVFNIDVEAQPHEIDIEFIEGPEAGNSNFGIYRLEGDQLEICLDLNAKPRPTEFRTSSGSGHAYEKLTRASHSRPANVTGGTPQVRHSPPATTTTQGSTGFEFVETSTMKRLQGKWTAVKLVLDGKELPAMMLTTGLRTTTQNQVKISFGGQLMIDALVRIDESTDPIAVDYYNLHGTTKGTVQQGIMRWVGDDVCLNMAAPDQPRPTDFDCPVGSGRTLSQWRPKK